MEMDQINNTFGDMDLYLLDQVLKGAFAGRKHLLDAGCGEGRNLIYFLQSDYDVSAIDRDKSAVDLTRYIAQELHYPKTFQIREGNLQKIPFAPAAFDAIICSRVLHFANSPGEFHLMWSELVRVLKPGGLLYLSMDSMIGMENHLKKIDEWKWQFSDGTVRFLLSEQLIGDMNVAEEFRWIEPIKTIIHGNKHAESVLVLEKR